MATATESNVASNISATTAAFTLRGGLYGIAAHATWGGGSAALQVLLPDNASWTDAHAQFTTDGYLTANLPAGQYRWRVTTATAVYLSATSILG